MPSRIWRAIFSINRAFSITEVDQAKSDPSGKHISLSKVPVHDWASQQIIRAGMAKAA